MRKPIALLAILCLLCFAAPARAETGVVTASALILRAGPGTGYAILCEIPQGARVELFTYADGWYHLAYENKTGYASARYIRVELAEGATAQPTPAWVAPTQPPQVPGAMPSLPALTFEENNPRYPAVMKPGDAGNSVIDLQKTLAALGYAVETDGNYGYDTQAAVMRLQLALGLDADGIVGAATRRAIGRKDGSTVELLDWWLGGNVAFARFGTATVTDVRTGIQFQIYRYGGDNHFDVEPSTASDAAKMLRAVGGSWNWARRPVWVTINGRTVAGSMNGMPHGGQAIWGNEFDGHFCIHLLSSRTHETDRVDEEHAACVLEAFNNRHAFR